MIVIDIDTGEVFQVSTGGPFNAGDKIEINGSVYVIETYMFDSRAGASARVYKENQ